MSLSLDKGDTRMIVDACLEHELLRNQCAYVLATAWHETGGEMKPIREAFAKSDAAAIAAINKAWKAGRLPWVKSDYWSGGFFGRGYVQLTHASNYEFAGKKIGVDLRGNPSLALVPEHAVQILVLGSKEGWFAGDKQGRRHRLDRYITLSKSDFVGARRIINGTDRAELIADYARQYDALLKAAGYGEKPASPKAIVPKASEPEMAAKPASPQIPTDPVVVHVEDNPPAVIPGPAQKQPESLWWKLAQWLLGWFSVKR